MSQTDQNLLDLAEQTRQNHKSKRTIENERNSQARELEDQLRGHLNEIVIAIVGEGSTDISLIQRRYGVEVEHLIRAAVHNAYSVGVNYVGEMKKRPHHIFLTSSDIGQIKRISAEYTHVFWRRVSAVLHQKDTVQNILKNARFSSRSKLSLTNLISSLAVAIITKALASGTVVKVNALRTLPPSIKQAQALDILVWRTAHDERVCPLCSSLDGMEWQSDDPNMLVPGDDTHDNCRCTIDLKSEQ